MVVKVRKVMCPHPYVTPNHTAGTLCTIALIVDIIVLLVDITTSQLGSWLELCDKIRGQGRGQ